MFSSVALLAFRVTGFRVGTVCGIRRTWMRPRMGLPSVGTMYCSSACTIT